MKGFTDFLEGWNEPLAQFKDQSCLQPLFKFPTKTKQEFSNKKYATEKKDNSNNYNPQIDTNQNKTDRFLHTIRQRKMLKKNQIAVQLLAKCQSLQLKQKQEDSCVLNKVQPLEQKFQQIGSKDIGAKQQSHKKLQMNTLSTTLYRCFDKNQNTKYFLDYSDGKNCKDQRQYAFKNGNLQKILRMKEKLRRKNHSHVQKIKLISSQGYPHSYKSQTPKLTELIVKEDGFRTPQYTLDLRPKRSTNIYQSEQKTKYIKTQFPFFKNSVPQKDKRHNVSQNERRNSTSTGIRTLNIQIMHRTISK